MAFFETLDIEEEVAKSQDEADDENAKAAIYEEWGSDSDESDIEPETYGEQKDESTTAPTSGEDKQEEKKFTGQFSDFGLISVGADKGFDAVKEQLQKRRKINVKILNKSDKVLQEPHWAFKDGKTEICPDLYIDKDGGEGEALFKGRTLKGALSYEIADTFGNTSNTRVVLLFKVLYFRGFEVGKWPVGKGRANQVGMKTIQRKAGSKWTKTKTGNMYKDNKSCLRETGGEYHTHETNGLKFRYIISDTGEAEVRVIVLNA